MPNKTASSSRAASSLPAQSAEIKFEVSAQILSFEPGLYSIDVAASQVLRGASGMVMPCIRLDPLSSGDRTRAFISTLSESPLIRPGDNASYLRVEAPGSTVLLTIYKLAGGMAAPELRIAAVQPTAARAVHTAAPQAISSEPLKVTAHVERAGDITVSGGAWAGQPGSRGAIEGFSITPEGSIQPEDIEYQAVLGSDWMTPWLSGGEFCGSRGLSLPLLGVRIRLRGEAARLFKISYWSSFVGAGEIGPIADGAVCSSAGAPLEALRVVVDKRRSEGASNAVPEPATSAASLAKSKPKAASAVSAGTAMSKPGVETPKTERMATSLPKASRR